MTRKSAGATPSTGAGGMIVTGGCADLLPLDQETGANDAKAWAVAVAAITAEFELLPPAVRTAVADLADTVYGCKVALHAVVERVNSGEACAGCGGACCRTGKYHFTVVDLLVYLVRNVELFIPRFGQRHCPYLVDLRCAMEPGYRPFNCVTFNCELVEDLVEPGEKERMRLLERELRELYRSFESLFGRRFMGGLLMSAERDLLGKGIPILNLCPP